LGPQDNASTDSFSAPSGVPPAELPAGEGAAAPSGSLAAHLERSDRGEEARLRPEQYADALAAVARSLAELHQRGVAHGNVRPASLSFDADTGRLALSPPELILDGAVPPAGDPYVAPEQHLGEQGPSIDQYALGVVARDVFTARAAPAPTAPLHDALRRATAPLPDDRYPDAGELGEALADAVRREAPHGLADRLEARSVGFRASLAPGGLMGGLILAVALDDARDPLLGPLFTAVLAPVAAVAAAVLVAGLVRLAIAVRRPSWPSLKPVQPAWVPVAAVTAIFAAVLLRGGDIVDSSFNVIFGVYAVRALLAPPPESSGRLLIALLRRWDMRRTLPPARRRAVSAAGAAAVLGVLLAPVAVGTLWPIPFEFASHPAREYAPVVSVANFRAAIGNDDYRYACRNLLTREAAAPMRDCPDVLRWASLVLSNDPALEGGRHVLGEAGTLDRFRVQELPPPGEGRFWAILAPGGERHAGAMHTEGTSETRVTVLLSRERPQPPGSDMHSLWLYEVVKRPRWWRIAAFRACDVGPPGSGRRDARCLVRDGLPGGRVRALLAKVESR
jgi:hypothetical protein